MRVFLKSLAFLLVTILILLFWIDEFVAFMIAIFGFLLFIPSILAVIYITITSRRLLNKSQKFFFCWGILIGVFLVSYFVFQRPKQQCNANIMAEHYLKHTKEMEDLILYLDKALDDSASIQLEFEFGKASIFHVAAKGDSLMSCHWDDAEEKKDSLMSVVGLSSIEYEKIYDSLHSLDCIGVEMTKAHLNAETIINFRRVGMGMYSFILYSKPMTNKEKEKYMSDEMYIPFSERVVFMYAGGAIGTQTFPKGEKEGFLKDHRPW